MKLLILLLSVCCALALPERDGLMEELDKLIHSEDHSDLVRDTDDLSQLFDDLGNGDDELTEEDKAWMKKFDESQATEKRGRGRFPYGLCMDGITPALGANGKGCRRALCYDMHSCKGISKRVCRKYYSRYRDVCPMHCGICKPRSPEASCRARFGRRAIFGCCWSGVPALRRDMSDCGRCVDASPHTCKQFNAAKTKCVTTSYRIRKFYYRRCAKTCGLCH